MTRGRRDISHDELILRLRKIEGQVRGLQRMIEGGDRCVDVLTQIASAQGALRAVAVSLIDAELRELAVDHDSATSQDVDRLLVAVERLARR